MVVGYHHFRKPPNGWHCSLLNDKQRVATRLRVVHTNRDAGTHKKWWMKFFLKEIRIDFRLGDEFPSSRSSRLIVSSISQYISWWLRLIVCYVRGCISNCWLLAPNNQLIIASHDLTSKKIWMNMLLCTFPLAWKDSPICPRCLRWFVSQSSPQESQTSGCSNTNLWGSIDNLQYPHAGMPPNLSACSTCQLDMRNNSRFFLVLQPQMLRKKVPALWCLVPLLVQTSFPGGLPGGSGTQMKLWVPWSRGHLRIMAPYRRRPEMCHDWSELSWIYFWRKHRFLC